MNDFHIKGNTTDKEENNDAKGKGRAQ